MAFIETKNFKPKNENANTIDETITAQLEAEGKRMIQVNINNAYQVMNISFVMNKDWQVSKVYDLLNEKKGDKTKYSQDKHVLLAF
jgi:uncharacterized protein YjdB